MTVIDVRGPLRDANPHHEPSLKPLTGLDSRVLAYITDRAKEGVFEGLVGQVVAAALAGDDVAVMCVGGKHRSVAVAEAAARRYPVADAGGANSNVNDVNDNDNNYHGNNSVSPRNEKGESFLLL